MSLKPITKFTRYIQGTRPLPAGAIPLASEGIAGLICLMPTGRWICWLECIQSRPPEIQKAVMEVVIDQLGGTSSTVAERLSVSPRTVEAWRSGKAPLNSRAAYHIAAVIKNCAAEIASRLATPPKAGMPWMIKEESVLPSANDIAKLAAEIVERNKVLKAAKDGKYLSYDQLNGWQIA